MVSNAPTSKFLNKFEKTRVDSEIPFSYIIFRQVDRVLDAQTHGTQSFLAGVEALETPILPKADKEYNDNILKIEDAYEKRIKQITKGRNEISDPKDEYNLGVAAYEKAKMKFREIMRLIDRVGMYPKSTGSYTDEGDDLPDDAFDDVIEDD